jgi:acetyl esterase/lipase
MTKLAAALSPVAILNTISGSLKVKEFRALSYGPGARERVDIYAPKGRERDLSAIVFFYGGGWEEGDRAMYRFVGTALASRGSVVAIPDYRVYPEVRFPGFVEDGARAVRWVRDNVERFGGDPGRIVVAGHSAGAYIAAMLAIDGRWLRAEGMDNHSLCGLVGLSGPYDFLPLHSEKLKVIFGAVDKRQGSQPINFVEAGMPPALLIAGTGDRVVDPANTTRLGKRLREAGNTVDFHHYPLVGHAPLIAAFAWPFRAIAPVLREVTEFVRQVTAEERAGEGLSA